jgi:hypothetical protein
MNFRIFSQYSTLLWVDPLLWRTVEEINFKKEVTPAK